MWALFTWQTQAKILTTAGVLVAWALDAVSTYFGVGGAPFWKWASLAVAIVVLILGTVLQMAWRPLWRRYPKFGRNLFPDLNGVWQGHLVSTWKNPETGESPPPIPTTITINQTLFTTSITLKTGESKSYSTRCLLERTPDPGIARVWYSYDNQPNAEVSHRSARHEGVAWLEMDLAVSNKLSGQYFTHRKTTGDISVTKTSHRR
jgi:hypothetical protein